MNQSGLVMTKDGDIVHSDGRPYEARAMMPGIRERLVSGEAWLECVNPANQGTIWINVSQSEWIEELSDGWQIHMCGSTYAVQPHHNDRLKLYLDWWDANLPTIDDELIEKVEAR